MAFRNRHLPTDLLLVAAYILVAALGVVALEDVSEELNASALRFYVRVLCLAAVTALLPLCGRCRVSFSLVDVPVGLLLALMTAGVLQKDGDCDLTKWYELLSCGCLYVSLRLLFSVEGCRHERWLLVIVCCLCLSESFSGLSQLSGHSSSRHGLFPMTGSFFNPGPYGGFLSVTGIMAAVYLFDRPAAVRAARPTTAARPRR